MMEAISAFFFVDGSGIGSMRESDAVRRKFAKSSRKYVCKDCGPVVGIEKVICDFWGGKNGGFKGDEGDEGEKIEKKGGKGRKKREVKKEVKKKIKKIKGVKKGRRKKKK